MTPAPGGGGSDGEQAAAASERAPQATTDAAQHTLTRHGRPEAEALGQEVGDGLGDALQVWMCERGG